MFIYDPELSGAEAKAAAHRELGERALSLSELKDVRLEPPAAGDRLRLWLRPDCVGIVADALQRRGINLSAYTLVVPENDGRWSRASDEGLCLLRVDDTLGAYPRHGIKLGVGAGAHLTGASVEGLRGAVDKISALGRAIRDTSANRRETFEVHVDDEVVQPAGLLVEAGAHVLRWTAAGSAQELLAALKQGRPTAGVQSAETASPMCVSGMRSLSIDGRNVGVERLSQLYVRSLPPLPLTTE